eukprot:TRINITY_DN12086_c0_g1_i1.p1 TRINITY_DN12086_c0_g1~~TRINITY_DN12086_c0_g1_i1.p1  ORF type:complete len:221 (+),score=41.87 TRINITY_DN12086_c0_g1_i1:420-1082(+)
MAEDYPISFYSRAKELSYGTNQERLLTSQLDRFFVEWMVEKVEVPKVIDHKIGSEEHLKVAVRTREEFQYKVNDSEKIVSTAMVLSKYLISRPHSFRVTARAEGIGMVFTATKDDSQEEKMKLIRKNTTHLPYQSGFNKVVSSLEEKLPEGWISCRTSNRHQYMQLFRALAALKHPFYFVKDLSPDPTSSRVVVSIPPFEKASTQEATSAEDKAPEKEEN